MSQWRAQAHMHIPIPRADATMGRRQKDKRRPARIKPNQIRRTFIVATFPLLSWSQPLMMPDVCKGYTTGQNSLDLMGLFV